MQVTRRFLLCTIIAINGICFTSIAQLNNPEIKNLSEKADVIITGKVTQLTANWNENQTRIYTQATIQVEEYLKGSNNESTVTVTYPGGEVGEIGEMYSHMPRFENQEEVLVFLKKDEKSSDYKVFNGENGKISVISDPQTGEKITTSNVKVSALKTQIKSYIID